MTWDDYLRDRDHRRNIERLAENVANASVDIAKIVLVGEDYEIPDTHRETVLQLGTVGVVDQTLATRLRNIPVHREN